MAIECNGTNLKTINFNGTNLTVVELNGNTIWCKPYTITISTAGYVEQYSVVRTKTNEPSAGVDKSLHSGQTIYYGDSITVNATAASGHKLNGTFPYTIDNVKSDVAVNITTSRIITPPSLEPNIYGQRIGNTITSVVAEIAFVNSNNVGVTCHYKITGTSVTFTDTKEGTIGISLNSTGRATASFSQQPFINSVTVEAYFTSNELTPVTSDTATQTFKVTI